MYKIPLKDCDGHILDYAFVDEEYFAIFSERSWNRNPDKYAQGTDIDGNNITMHAWVMKAREHEREKGYVIDHIDGNKMNNTNANLQFASKSQNSQNKITPVGKSGFRCVSFESKKYRSRMQFNNVHYSFGSFEKAEDAAKQSDKMALRLFGKNAQTNNLLTKDEIAECLLHPLKEKDMHQFKRGQRELPTGVYLSGEKYDVHIGNTYFGRYDTVEKANNARNKILAEQKEKKDLTHNSQEITRNSEGQAIINLFDKNGEIICNTIVDDDDWYELSKYTWHFNKKYVVGHVEGTTFRMHRWIMQAETDDIIDHVSGNKLDNRRANLEFSDAPSNAQNKPKAEGGSSKFIGVHFEKRLEKWRATISKDNVCYRLGCFENEIDAAKAYNTKAKELYKNPRINIFPE
jgi:hypothetical protein